MTHKLIPLDSKNEWNEALKGIDHSFGHTWDHCYSMYLTTGHDTYLYCFEKDDSKIVSPVIEREFSGFKDISKPFGFSGFTGDYSHNDFLSEWENFVDSKGYVSGYLGLHPVYDKSSLFDSSEIVHYNNAYVLGLKPDINEILAKMARKRRQQFNDWQEIASNFTENRFELERFFLKHYDDFLKRKKAKSFYFFSPETITYLFSLDNIFVAGVNVSGKIVAATYFAYTYCMGDALYHLSLPGAEKYSAPLLWYGAKQLKSLGIPALNLGGGFNGIAKFKKRFGTKTYPLKAVKQIYRKDIYDSLCKEANIDPNDDEGFFPAYRKNC
jgi:hypothetical protein